MVIVFVPELSPTIRSIVKELRMERRRNMRLCMPCAVLENDKALKTALDIRKLEKGVHPDMSVCCFEWDYRNSLAQPIQPIDSMYNYCVEQSSVDVYDWAILTERVYPKKAMLIFQDAPHKSHLPDDWHCYPCFNNKNDLIAYCDKIEAPIYKLSGNPLFTPSSGKYKHTRGAQVYKEKTTGRLWYLDTLHKDHFEIFDGTGMTHWGEADRATGTPNPTKADPDKLPIK